MNTILNRAKKAQDDIETYLHRRFTISDKPPHVNTRREQTIMDILGAISLVIMVWGTVHRDPFLIGAGVAILMLVLFDPGDKRKAIMRETDGTRKEDMPDLWGNETDKRCSEK